MKHDFPLKRQLAEQKEELKHEAQLAQQKQKSDLEKKAKLDQEKKITEL
jgi:hypothetical protein